MLHDNADADRTIARSASEYAAIWDASLARLISNLAVVDVSTRFECDDGDIDVASTRSSLALYWRIFREHGSALRP
jgi:hypothetical protein